MRTIKQILKTPLDKLTEKEKQQLQAYLIAKKAKHSTGFIYHARKLPEE